MLLTLRLTALLFVLYGANDPYSRVPMQLLSGSMLLRPKLVRSQWMWWALALTSVASNGVSWYALDNHKYLMSYWAIACAISIGLPDGKQALRRVSQSLIAIVFSAAVAWKLIAGEFINGSFFYFTFLTDPRLERISLAIVGITRDKLTAFSGAMQYVGINGIANIDLPLPNSSSLAAVTLALSVGGLIVEALVAVVHILPSERLRSFRHYALIAFIVLTYFMLPVFPFCVILTVLGFAQTSQDEDHARYLYLALLGAMHLTLIPWQPLLWPRS